MALIGKRNSQSVLSDDALLFQPTEEKSELRKWKEMNASERRQYFLDYYLLKCGIVVALLGLFVYLACNILRPQKTVVLFTAIMEHTLEPAEKENLSQQMAQLFITDADSQEIRLDDSFPNGYESQIKLQAYLTAQELDLVIAKENTFVELAKSGCFEDLNLLMPAFAKENENLLYWTNGYSEEDPDNEKQEANYQAYGVHIIDCPAFENSLQSDTKFILGIIKTGPQKENAKIAVKKIFH